MRGPGRHEPLPGPVPVPGARHDAHAFEAFGLKDLIAGMDAAADLRYTGSSASQSSRSAAVRRPRLNEELAGYSTSSRALRFRIDEPLPLPLAEKLIAVRLQQAFPT